MAFDTPYCSTKLQREAESLEEYKLLAYTAAGKAMAIG